MKTLIAAALIIIPFAASFVQAETPQQVQTDEAQDFIGHYKAYLLEKIPTGRSVSWGTNVDGSIFVLVTTASGPTAKDIQGAPKDVEGIPVHLQ